jgi:shikimate dehydrogenase
VAKTGVEAAAAEECDVLVNATPLGLRRDDAPPIPLELAPNARAALDLVYTSGETPWVHHCRARGLEARDGRTMLLAQGVAAFRRWYPDIDPPEEIMRAALRDALR